MEKSRNIIIAGLKFYEKKVKGSKEPGGRKLHESSESTASRRCRKKIMSKTSWFKQRDRSSSIGSEGEDQEVRTRGNGVPQSGGRRVKTKTITTDAGNRNKVDKITTVLFVENTRYGELAKRLRQEEEKLSIITGFRVKVVEKCGTKVKSLVSNANPWSSLPCGRKDCVPCGQNNKKPINCFKRSVLYESICDRCLLEKKVERSYVGESARQSEWNTKEARY